MTRENKLALVVGFALILLVGILISDHFSVARNQVSADLSDGILDPLIGALADQPGLITLNSPARLEPGPGPDTLAPATGTAAPAQQHKTFVPVFMAADAPPVQTTSEIIGLSDTQAAELPFTYHELRPRETLAAVCRLYFGDAALAGELAAYNGIDDPDAVTAGRRLRVPRKAEALVRGAQPLASSPPATPPVTDAATGGAPERPDTPATTFATYTIKKGDVLSRLSQELLGTTKRMKELIDLNRDVIKNPDRLIPGTVIKVPK